MKKFKYVAYNIKRKRFQGSFYAENEDDLRAMLVKQNLFLISAKIVTEKTPNAFFSISGKVSLTELTGFCRQFAIMINSGISILECLFILKEQPYSSVFKKVLDMIYENVKTGVLLSEAMRVHKKVFPEFFVNMIYVGEVTSKLDDVFNNLADYYEKDAYLKRKIKGALAYPVSLLVMLVGVLAIMMLFVIPTFRESMDKLEVEIPPITQFFYNFSDWLIANGLNLLLGIAITVFLLIIIGRTKKGRLFFDELKLKIPLIKNVQVNMLTSKFANSFGLLISSGLDMVDALEVVSRILGNKYFEKRFLLAVDDVRNGTSLIMALDGYKLFPQILIQMLSIGEKSDSIGSVLSRSTSFFDAQVERAISSMSSLLQPVMLAIMGGTIAVIFVAIYSPMLSIMTSLG